MDSSAPEAPTTGPDRLVGALAAVCAGVLTAALEFAADAVTPGSPAPGTATAVTVITATLPLLFLCFWGLNGLIVDAGARLVAPASRARAYLGASGPTLLVLAGFGVVRLLQAAIAHGGPGTSGLIDAAGFLDAPVLLAFLWLNVRAVEVTYDMPRFNAAATALLPYAVLGALLLLLVVVTAVLQGPAAR